MLIQKPSFDVFFVLVKEIIDLFSIGKTVDSLDAAIAGNVENLWFIRETRFQSRPKAAVIH